MFVANMSVPEARSSWPMAGGPVPMPLIEAAPPLHVIRRRRAF